MVRKNERGSVVGFVIGGVVLLGLLAAGIYVVRQNMLPNVAAPDKETATTTAPAKKDDTTAEQKSADLKQTLAAQAEAQKKAEDQLKAQQAESKPAAETTTPAPSTPSASTTAIPTTGVSTTASPAAATSGAKASASLPATGPEDTVISAVGMAVLAAVGVAFVRSRATL